MFWFHQDIERLEKEITALKYNPKLIFYGSSTFTLWSELTTVFKEYSPVNLGFGGSTLAACTWYFDRVFKNIKDPEAIVIYAGDNDLGEGRHPEEVLLYLENLLAKIRAKYGNIPCTFISIKPSLNRWNLSDSIRFTNSIIEQLMTKDVHFNYVNIYDLMLDKTGNPNLKYFAEDGLHLSKLGYLLWLDVLKSHPEIFFQNKLSKKI
jgi:lysophospholipase L1-like esterase